MGARTREQFGCRLRELRKARGMTQQEVGEAADVEMKHISNIELGRGNPTLLMSSRLAEALGVSLLDLMDLEPEATPVAELRKQLDAMLDEADESRVRLLVRIARVCLVRP